MAGRATATSLLQLCEKHQVKVAALYNQMFDDRKDKDDLTEPGWCLGMVAQWLSYSEQGKDQAFWSEMETDSMIAKLRPVMARQAVILKKLKDQADPKNSI